MENKTKNLVRISPSELDSANNKRSLIEEYNKKLQQLRSNQLYKSVKQSTDLRNEMLEKLRTWMKLIEDRIFEKQTITDMDISRVIGLFEHLNNVSLSMFKQTNDMEVLLKTYTDSQIERESKLTKPETNKVLDKDQENLKATLMKSFLQSLGAKPEEAEVIEIKKEPENFSESVPGKLTEKNPVSKETGLEDLPSLDEEETCDSNTPAKHEHGNDLNECDGNKDDKIELDEDD